jgi:hypothetical protein
MIEEQVKIKGLSVHFERNLAANKSEARPISRRRLPRGKGVIPVIPVFVEIGFPGENL